jgi:lysophospholipase L1-like esterase
MTSYTNDIYGMLLKIADGTGAPDTYPHDQYGQIKRIADRVGAPAAGYSGDKYSQLKRIADQVGAVGAYTGDIYAQIKRIADAGASGAYTNDIYGQLTRIAVNGIGSAALPSGASGIWYASDYVASPRKTIPNSLSPSADPNLLSFPRSSFLNTNVWGLNQATLTDNNAVAPDGSTEASTFAGAASQQWYLKWSGTGLPTTGTFTVALSVKAVSGTANFKLGDLNTTLTPRTATTSWQRFSATFTAIGAVPFLCFISSDSINAGTFAICDFQVFAGSSDLNINALTAKPVATANAELVVGYSNASSATVSSGAFQHGGLGCIQFPAAFTPSTFTLVYLAKRSGVIASTGFSSLLSCADGDGNQYGNFNFGYYFSKFGATLNSLLVDAAGVTTLAAQQSEDLFTQSGSGTYVAAHRYDGSTAASFINGTKVLNNSVTKSAVSVRSFMVGGLFTGLEGDHDIYAMAYYPRALTDAEIRQAYAALKIKATTAGVSVTERRIVVFDGDSLTFGQSGFSYAYRFAPNSSPPCNGSNFATSGSGLGGLVLRATDIDAVMSGSPSTKFILSVDIGANDIGFGTGYAGNPTGYATALASYLDARRAAGWKVVIHTILARLDQADGGTQFNSDRAAVNTTIRTWVGTHCDAVADVAGDATIGTNTAPNNATYFNADKIHPTDAAYVIWEPYTRAAINSL